MAKKLRKLTAKQLLFVEYYIQTKNATQSAEKAGYKGSYQTLRAVGSENLSKPHIRAAIADRFSETIMDSNEVLSRLGAMARGFDLLDYAEIRPVYALDKEGESVLTGHELWLDLDKIRKDGYGHLIKKLTQTASGISIERFDSHGALVDIGKAEGLFPHKIDLDADVKGPSMGKVIKAMQEAEKELKDG